VAQHFVLSAAARTLSLRSTYAGGEQKAYRRFCALRWSETNGSPVCSRCGCLESYNLKARRRFKCAACHYQFSATSGTIFASHKLSFVDLLGAICLFVNASKGMSAVQLSRDLDVQYKTAFVLMHKLREAMAHETAETRLAGEVEIDGAYFGGHVRPTNAMNAPVAIADPRGANLLNPSFKAGVLATTGFVMVGRTIEFEDAARPPNRDAPIIANRRRQLALASRPYSFRRMTSWSISRSRDRSATIFFSFAFSSSNCFSRRISGGCRPSYRFFQLK
jgi:transposase-like protein